MDFISADRRTSARFELRLPLRYRVSQGTETIWKGTGRTVDISRTGIRFHSSRPFPLGSHVELQIEWPIRYGDLFPMQLNLRGIVVRSDNKQVVLRNRTWEFRVVAAEGREAATERSHGWSPRCRRTNTSTESPLVRAAVM